jgi:hypothetical protein
MNRERYRQMLGAVASVALLVSGGCGGGAGETRGDQGAGIVGDGGGQAGPELPLRQGDVGPTGPEVSAPGLDVAPPDSGGVDGAADSGAAEVGEGACGPAREPLDTQAGAIVGGLTTWNPAILPLSSAQALAVGALLSDGPGASFDIECTASLVAPKVVLTAAHCVVTSPTKTTPASALSFGVGADMAKPVHVFQVAEVHAHPAYDYWGDDASHDVAILVLAKDAVATLGASIEPLPIHCGALSKTGFVGTTMQVVGYGATDTWGEVFGTARLWATELVTALSSLDFTVDGQGTQGVCYGDSGGPGMRVQAGGVAIVGVLSWGDTQCGREDHFVRTDHECSFLMPYLPACGAVTALGSCSGQVARYCADDAVVEDDCVALGASCAVNAAGEARCVAKTVEDPCAGETASGRCDGDSVVRCEGDAVVREECGAAGHLCQLDPGGAAKCVAPDPCGGETFAGRCVGTDVVWCQGGQVRQRPCGDCGQVCGWVTELGGYDCVAP